MSMVRVLGAWLAGLIVAMGGCAGGSAPKIKTETVTYEAGGATMRGYLAYDANAKGRRPGVLVCHEWWGNNEYAARRCRDLAALGYVAFALDMYGDGKTTTSAEQASAWSQELYRKPAVAMERVQQGYLALAERPEVDSTRMAAIGYCMGGTVALAAGRSGVGRDNLRAIVCFHTSHLTANNPEENKRIKGEVLVCHGEADTFVPAEMLKNFEAEMKLAGVKYRIERYPGAVHAFTNPDADSYKLPGVSYNRAADGGSWRAMRALFARTIDRE